jgi:hypothetical protein
MLASPAYRALSLTGHRILARIELELCRHAGKDNGTLIVTYKDFQSYGIHHHAIGPGLRELEALGFIEIVQRGLAGNADHRRPHTFRLTYQPTDDGEPATDEWQHIKTVKDAEEIAINARNPRPISHCRKTRKPMPETGSGSPRFSVPETGSDNPKIPVPETGSTF